MPQKKPIIVVLQYFFFCVLAFLHFANGAYANNDIIPTSLNSIFPAKHQSLVQIYGDAKIEGSIGEPSNLIPPLSSDSASSQVSGHMYISLVRYNKFLEIEPYAAESFEVLDDGLRLRFKLRRGLQWMDGRTLDANDVEFTYRLMIDPNTPTAYAGDYLRVKEFRKIDDYTIEVAYDQPYARSLISWMISILPRHALEGEDLATTPLRRNPLASGPFRLKSWEPGSRVVLVANDKYFKGRPYLDGLVVRIIPDLATMFMELRAGKLDSMGLTPQQYVYQTGSREFKGKYNVYRDLSLGYTFLGYNLRSPLFSDVRVRRAFAHAINKDDIVDGVLFGQGIPTIGPYTPGTWVYNERISPYSYDMEAAARLLAEAGWLPGKGGMLHKDGIPFEFTILVNQGNEQRTKIAVIVQSQLKRLGISAKIRAVEWSAFLSEFVNKGFFDAIVLGWSTTLDPDLHSVWHSSNAFPGGLNFIGYKNEEVDALIEEGRSTFDQAVRKRCYDRIQEILHAEQPYAFLYVPYALPAVHKRFRGLEPVPVMGVDHNLPEWWVPAEEQLYRNLLNP